MRYDLRRTGLFLSLYFFFWFDADCTAISYLTIGLFIDVLRSSRMRWATIISFSRDCPWETRWKSGDGDKWHAVVGIWYLKNVLESNIISNLYFLLNNKDELKSRGFDEITRGVRFWTAAAAERCFVMAHTSFLVDSTDHRMRKWRCWATKRARNVFILVDQIYILPGR